METTRRDTALAGPIRLLFEGGTVAGMSDGQLLDRFLDRRTDAEAAEVAFAALVERHGPMVLRAYRARLGDEHDAQDAFQATFLILARKAESIRKHDSAASWLQGVARRVAACARRAAAVRRAKERTAAGRAPESARDPDRADLVPVVREEVGDLPEKYRTPLVLCLLDGLTHEEAATRLGWPVGTVKTRVRHAKDRLRTRLARRGLAPSLAAIGAALAAREASAMPAALVRSTARAALRLAAGREVISASVTALVKLGLGSMLMNRLKVAALVVTSVGALAFGVTGLARQAPGPQEKRKPAEARPDVKDAAVAPRVLKPAEVEAEADVRLQQIEASRLDIELLRMEVEGMKQRVVNSQRNYLSAKERLQSLGAPRDPQVVGFNPLQQPLTGQTLEEVRKQAQDYLNYTEQKLAGQRLEFLAKSRDLKREERRLKELAENLPWPIQAEVLRSAADQQRAGESKPTADVDRRLSDVERKLDLILKALENQGREPGKK